MCDTPERPLEIKGRDVIPFLDKIFPRQISKLKVGKGIYVTALTYEVGLSNFIDLKKKSFIGKEKLITLPKHKLLFGFISNSIIPKGGLHIYDDRKKHVGLVTTGAYSPLFKSGIGYVKFSKKIE